MVSCGFDGTRKTGPRSLKTYTRISSKCFLTAAEFCISDSSKAKLISQVLSVCEDIFWSCNSNHHLFILREEMRGNGEVLINYQYREEVSYSFAECDVGPKHQKCIFSPILQPSTYFLSLPSWLCLDSSVQAPPPYVLSWAARSRVVQPEWRNCINW